MDLNFQNFESVNSTNEQSGPFVGNIGDRNNLVGGESAPGGSVFDDNQSTTSTRRSNLFSIEYYQQFFDVETDQVVKRLLNSIVPTHKNYIQDFLQPIPDLWGPFWVSVTLVFAIGIFGNLAQFVENDGVIAQYNSDFRMVTSASTLIFLYVTIVPLIIYGLLWNRRSEMMHPYVDLVCLYGYSLTIFIPVSLLWIIDLNWFRWALILVSVGLSGTVLARAIWPAVKNDENKMIAFGTIFGVVFLHFLLAFTFKEFYFDSMHPKRFPDNNLVTDGKLEIVPPPMTGVNNGTAAAPEAPAQILLANPAAGTTTSTEKPKEIEPKIIAKGTTEPTTAPEVKGSGPEQSSNLNSTKTESAEAASSTLATTTVVKVEKTTTEKEKEKEAATTEASKAPEVATTITTTTTIEAEEASKSA